MLAAVLLPILAQGSLADLEARVRRRPNAANYRALADAYLNAERYQQASAAFAQASVLYRKLGDPNAAEVLISYSKRYQTTIQLFAELPLDESWARRYYSRAKFEPLYGCYVGANIERESVRDPEAFSRAIGKRHATFFMYRTFGAGFPKELARQLKGLHAGLQIAWEPNSLEGMDDYRTVEKFAQDAKASGIPIFLRFASEMNGPWTPYNGNPPVYREKFRTVAKMMHTLAPNVAMVWCPNEIPKEPIDSYYPGPEAVDWVGINFYSVLYNDGLRSRPAQWRNPADALETIYARYSARHPIMVGEWAATHQSVLESTQNPQFARNKIGQFYASLPRLYPRVKAVHWLSMDTMTYASGPRKLNNFSLLDNRLVAEKYRDMLSPSYFLETAEVDAPPKSATQYVPLKPSMSLPYGTRISAIVRSYEQQPRVSISVNGQSALSQTEVDDYGFTLSKTGKCQIRVDVTDSRGRSAGVQAQEVVVR